RVVTNVAGDATLGAGVRWGDMKTAFSMGCIGLVGLASLLGASPFAAAAEDRADRETDHLDAFDDGGPRSVGLLLNPGALTLGTFAAEGDFVLGDAAALSVEGDWISTPGTTAYGAMVGVPLFPWRVVFHGLYLHPRALLGRGTSDGL